MKDKINTASKLEVNSVKTSSLRVIQESDCALGGVREAEKCRLIQLLNKYRKTIALETSELGLTTAGEMIIELTSDDLIYRKPYRMGMDERTEVKKITTDLERKQHNLDK